MTSEEMSSRSSQEIARCWHVIGTCRARGTCSVMQPVHEQTGQVIDRRGTALRRRWSCRPSVPGSQPARKNLSPNWQPLTHDGTTSRTTNDFRYQRPKYSAIDSGRSQV